MFFELFLVIILFQNNRALDLFVGAKFTSDCKIKGSPSCVGDNFHKDLTSALFSLRGLKRSLEREKNLNFFFSPNNSTNPYTINISKLTLDSNIFSPFEDLPGK